jgi:hypothetical protein
MWDEYLVPMMTSVGGRAPPRCRISSPWIDIVVDWKPIPQIQGIVRWNERQLLADQAVLAGAKNVPQSMAMPLNPRELGYFIVEYEDTEYPYPRKPVTKPIEERVLPDLLWLLRRSRNNERAGPFGKSVLGTMDDAVKKGAKGYTKLVITLIDRCFASSGTNIHYSSVLDAADLALLKQYKIDMPLHR